jgi:hypothetical protein
MTRPAHRPARILPEQTQQELREIWADDQARAGAFIRELNEAGWGFNSSAKALGISRETARKRAQDAPHDVGWLPAVPEAPPKVERPRKERPSPPEIPWEVAKRLRELHRLGHQLRGEHAEDDPRRVASEDLTRLMDELTRQGHSYAQIGAELGLKPMSIRGRLKRHGYRRPNPSLTPYAGRRPDKEKQEVAAD